jgi:hypothetical protein
MTLQMSLVSDSTVSLGEPIVLKYVISNSTDNEIDADTGRYWDQDWFDLAMVSTDGRVAKKRSWYKPIEQGGMQVIGGSRMASAHGDYTSYIVVPKEVDIPGHGDYTLTISAHLPYGIIPPHTGSGDYPSGTNIYPNTYRQRFTFHISITAADPVKLKTVAQSLAVAIQQGNFPIDYGEILADELFSMPEPEASDSWVFLGMNHRGNFVLNRVLAADRLLRLHDTKSADILAYLQWDTDHPTTNPDPGTVEYSLQEMYNSADAALKDHIRRLYADHGIVAPEKFALVVDQD